MARAVVREDGARQSVRRSVVTNLERLVELAVRIDVHRDDGSEDLLFHELELRILGDDGRGLNEVAPSSCHSFPPVMNSASEESLA